MAHTIDSQVHAYERNRPERPWNTIMPWPDEVTGDDMVAAMDAVGVDGALLISPFSMYRYDASYALEVYARHPGRFGLIKPFDPKSEVIPDEMAEWAGTPGVVGARIMLTAQPYEADDPGLNRILVAGAQAGIPVNVMCSGKLPLILELARRHGDFLAMLNRNVALSAERIHRSKMAASKSKVVVPSQKKKRTSGVTKAIQTFFTDLFPSNETETQSDEKQQEAT